MKKLFHTVLVLLCVAMVAQGATRSKKNEISRNLDIFNALFKEMQTFYVDSIDAEKSINTAIRAMLNELDPYTVYIPQSEQAAFRTISTGEYGGIGASISQKSSGDVYVTAPSENSPAYRYGLRAGDQFIMIDNDTVLGIGSDKVSQKLKGQPGTKVNLRIKRPFVTDSILDFTIVREKIVMPSVPYYGVVKDNIGYICLTGFDEKSPKEVKEALTELKKNPAVKSIVLDLRGNGGGLLESAVKIVGLFVPKGTEVLSTRGKGVLNEKVYKTTSAPVDTEIPLAVLVDGNTASSAEIVSGALQDLDRAVIVGNRSYGKGLVQSTRSLPYEGLLKVTTAKYYIPSGRLIQAIDYSHRNPDGSVGRIPDSLTHEFTTAHGRKVRDGGGIVPDVEVEYPEVSRITYNIVRDNWAFDYANKYATTHATIPPIDDFVITDSIYEDFKGFIDPAKFNYDKVCEMMLNQLREAAGIEGYMTDSVKAQFDVLEGMLKHPLEKDLDTNRKAIEPYLAREIAQRYYFQRGEIIEALKDDQGLDEAERVLNDKAEYRRLLSPQPASTNTTKK